MDTGLAGSIGSNAAGVVFKAAYVGTLQIGDAEALLIPADAHPIPVPFSQIVGVIQSAQEGVDILINAYRGVTLIDTAVLEAGQTEVYFDVTPGVIDPFEVVTFQLDWVGNPTTLGITLTMRLQKKGVV